MFIVQFLLIRFTRQSHCECSTFVYFQFITSPLSLQLIVVDKDGSQLDRLSPWATYVTVSDRSVAYDQRMWNPPANEVGPNNIIIIIKLLFQATAHR